MPSDHPSFFIRQCITLYGQKNVSLENHDKGLEKVLKKSGILLIEKRKNPVYVIDVFKCIHSFYVQQ